MARASSELLELEEAFWRRAGDADFYDANMTDDAFMVFPAPAGIMDRDATLAAVAAASPWITLEMAEVHVLEQGDSAVVAYRAQARRAEGPEYNTYASSVYVNVGGDWKLAVHQQTPIAAS
jgi:ketosteroid isomerase-like protein